MSDWTFLNDHRVKEASKTVDPRYVTDNSWGFNGMFRFNVNGRLIRCVVSDGLGWQHVSVSIEYETKPPSWDIMCKIKELFWEPEDVVVQYHPAKSQYVNMHPGCLHLWRRTEKELPIPDPLMVGYKQLNVA